MVARPTSLSLRLLGCSANFLVAETSWLLGQILSPRLLLRSTSSSPASVCWALIRRSHPQRPTSAGLASSTSPSMASLTPGLSTSTSPSMASVRWTFISSTHRRRPGSLLDLHHRHHRRWPASAGLNLVDSLSTASVPLDLSLSTSTSTASVPLDFLSSTRCRRPAYRWTFSSSTRRQRPACLWAYSRRLVVNGQRAAGLPRVDSSSTASVPLDL